MGKDADSAVGPTLGANSHVGRLTATLERVGMDSKTHTKNANIVNNIEQVSYRAFKRGANTG